MFLSPGALGRVGGSPRPDGRVSGGGTRPYYLDTRGRFSPNPHRIAESVSRTAESGEVGPGTTSASLIAVGPEESVGVAVTCHLRRPVRGHARHRVFRGTEATGGRRGVGDYPRPTTRAATMKAMTTREITQPRMTCLRVDMGA